MADSFQPRIANTSYDMGLMSGFKDFSTTVLAGYGETTGQSRLGLKMLSGAILLSRAK